MCILLVEDEILVAATVQALLEELGYPEVAHAPDLPEAARLADEIAPQFAILDVNIGRDQVFPVAAELARRRVPFFFSTGESSDSLPPEWRSYPIVAKPMGLMELEGAIGRLGLDGDGRRELTSAVA